MSALIQGRDIATRRAQNRSAWLAWHVAALSRTKKLPNLRKLQVPDRRQTQTWQEQAAIFEMIARAHNKAIENKAKRG